MNRDDYVKISNKKLEGNSKNIMLNQINNYYLAKECNNYRDIIYKHISTKEGYLNNK